MPTLPLATTLWLLLAVTAQVIPVSAASYGLSYDLGARGRRGASRPQLGSPPHPSKVTCCRIAWTGRPAGMRGPAHPRLRPPARRRPQASAAGPVELTPDGLLETMGAPPPGAPPAAAAAAAQGPAAKAAADRIDKQFAAADKAYNRSRVFTVGRPAAMAADPSLLSGTATTKSAAQRSERPAAGRRGLCWQHARPMGCRAAGDAPAGGRQIGSGRLQPSVRRAAERQMRRAGRAGSGRQPPIYSIIHAPHAQAT